MKVSIFQIIRENKVKLVEWDIRFEHLRRLLQLYEVALEGISTDISDFIDSRIKELKETIAEINHRKNILVGAILSTLTVIIGWILKTYQKEIIDMIGKLV